ncbi:unnamed protein product, partial [Polarella glacialis]
ERASMFARPGSPDGRSAASGLPRPSAKAADASGSKTSVASATSLAKAPIRKLAVKTVATGAAAKSGIRKGVSGAPGPGTPRSQGPPRFKEGSLFVHTKEPLLGDPLVLINVVEEADGPRAVARILCSGRTVEVRGSSLLPLEIRPAKASSGRGALTSFEELFFIGGLEELEE